MGSDTQTRNDRIRELYDWGESGIDLAHQYGISRARIDQIIHPARQRARAIAFKKLPKTSQVCGVCSSPDVQRHHDDYSKPLQVRWLCPACHGKAHRTPKTESRNIFHQREPTLTETVQLRLTPGLKALAEREANLRGTSMSAVIRWAICNYYGLPGGVEPLEAQN